MKNLRRRVNGVRTPAWVPASFVVVLLSSASSAGAAVHGGEPCGVQADKRAEHCRAVARSSSVHPSLVHPSTAKAHPPIETGGTLPALDNTIPLLKPGMFRLDMSALFATYPLFGIGNAKGGASSSIIESLTLGYGVNDRFTVFGGAVEANANHADGGYRAEFVDPHVGFVYRVAKAPQLWGASLDFIGDVAANAPLQTAVRSTGPYGDLGPIVRGRVLATREFGHGLTLQANGGFQTAVVTTWPSNGLPDRTIEVDALLGLGGQYRLSAISDRLFINGEIDWLKPLTNDQQIAASPFRTAEVYSATLGGSYVIKPGFLVARLTDTIALNVVNSNNLFPPVGPRHFVSNTVGLTLSFVNWTPESLLKSALR